MPQPEKIGDMVRVDRMFSQDANGHPIRRDRTCECGRSFTQTLLSERFLTIVEKARVMERFKRDVPGFYVPVHCPACERVDLGRAARIAESHEPRPNFGERDAA